MVVSEKERKTVAIIGDGQLAKLLIESLHGSRVSIDRSQIKVHVLASPSPRKDHLSPVAHLADSVTYAGKPLHQLSEYDFQLWINGLCSSSCSGDYLDAIILETEHVHAGNLKAVLKRHYGGDEGLAQSKCWPNLDNLLVIQDKWMQRHHLQKNNIKQPYFIPLQRGIGGDKEWVVKRRRLGYDGGGCYFVKSNEWDTFFTNEVERKGLSLDDFYVEERIAEMEECSLIVVKTSDDAGSGNVFCFPLTKTVQNDQGTCAYTITPYIGLSEKLEIRAREVAIKVAESFNSHGIFAVEMFIDLRKTNALDSD